MWWKYCEEKGVPIFNANVFQIIDFLQTLLENSQINYGSFNSHRSAISLISSDSLGSHPLLKRFMKGVARKRPAKPHYNFTWDPQPVLKFLGDAPEDNLKSLSRKLATLLALVTGGRLQTIALIRISNIRKDESRIQIKITDPIKTSLSFKMQPCLNFPFFTDNQKICPASTLLKYIEITRPIRNNEDFLFISFAKPYKKATKQTISRWVKEVLTLSGIDTTIYKSHSTRHSATSAAHRAGLSLETICRTAGWSQNTSTFAKFYDRPLQDIDDFANTLLRISNKE